MVHTILFDIGGTLITSGNLFLIIARELDENNKGLSNILRTEFNKLYADKNPDNFLTLSEILSIVLVSVSKNYNLKDLSDKAKDFYREAFINAGIIFPETIEVLTLLKDRNIQIIAVTDADEEVMYDELKHFKILSYFNELIISSRVGAYKPADKFINKILELCKKPYSDVLFVGDSEVDVLTAKKIGVKSVLIDRHNTQVSSPDYRISNLKELAKLL